MSGDKLKKVIDGVKAALKKDSGELPDVAGAAGDSVEANPDDVEKLKEFVSAFTKKLGGKAAGTPGIEIHWAIYVIILIVFVSTIGLFGYRLVQSLQEKERKREEKRKLKESKKKK